MAIDYSKLDDEQLANAAKVAAAAQKYGINPDFVMPMVMAESGFRHIKNPNSNAFGIMQLMPATAKGLKVDPNDVDENIEGGMRLLKELSGNPKIGSDPYKVLAGYNAGPSTAFLASGDLKDLPDETLSHMAKVANFYGGELPALAFEKTEESAPEETAPEPPLIPPGNIVTGTQPGTKKLSPEALSLIGGGAGLTVGATGVTAQKSAGLIKDLYGRAFPGAPGITRAVEPAFVPEAAPSGVEGPSPLKNAPGHERWLEPRSATPIPKAFSNEMTTMTGGANVPGSGENILARNSAAVQKVKELGYNPLTMEKYGDLLLTEPSKVRPTAQVWNRPRAIGPAPWANPNFSAPTASAAPAPSSPLPVTPAATAPRESVLGRMGRYASKVAPVVAPIAKIGFSGLSGALGANQLYEAEKNREKNGLTFGNSLDYLSGVGGLVGMIPTVPTQAAAMAMQSPAAIKALRDYINAHPEEFNPRGALQNMDAMGNPY